MQPKPNTIIYVDNLSMMAAGSILTSWLGARLLRRCGPLVINYFDSTAGGRRSVAAFRRFQPIESHEMDYSLADVRDNQGACPQLQVLSEDTLKVSRAFSDHVLESHPLVRRMKKYFTGERILIFLRQNAGGQISLTLLKTNVVPWFHRTRHENDLAQPRFYVARSILFPFVKSYAADRGVQLTAYRNLPDVNFKRIRFSVSMAWRIGLRLPFLMIRRGRRQLQTSGPEGQVRGHKSQAAGPTVLVPLDGNGLSMNPQNNSDLFWIPSTKINREQILSYAYRADFALDESKIQALKEANIRYVARSQSSADSPDAPQWSPSLKMIKMYFGLWLKVVTAGVISSLTSPRISFWILPRILKMVQDYAVWYDFYRSYNVKLTVSCVTASTWRIPAEQALERLGGISLIYQRSLANFPSTHYASAVDVHFTFGSTSAQIHRQSGSDIPQLINGGYIHDHGFTHVAESAAKVRAKLEENGADFVICYLDENPNGDKKYSTVVNEDAAANYKFLLEMALEDPKLGLIFKPKKPAELWRSLGPVADLLQQAIDTGRCIVYDAGIIASPTLPSETAAASDVVISLMVGGTAGLECGLAGVPSVYLDQESINYHPLYALGKDKVAFQSWDDLWQAISRFREDPNGSPSFGNWSSVADSMDPFRDGKAAERIGTYVTWLADGLNDGLSRDQVMGKARQNYVDFWGEDKIVSIEPNGHQTQQEKELVEAS